MASVDCFGGSSPVSGYNLGSLHDWSNNTNVTNNNAQTSVYRIDTAPIPYNVSSIDSVSLVVKSRYNGSYCRAYIVSIDSNNTVTNLTNSYSIPSSFSSDKTTTFSTGLDDVVSYMNSNLSDLSKTTKSILGIKIEHKRSSFMNYTRVYGAKLTVTYSLPSGESAKFMISVDSDNVVNGSLSPEGSSLVNSGTVVTYTCTPNSITGTSYSSCRIYSWGHTQYGSWLNVTNPDGNHGYFTNMTYSFTVNRNMSVGVNCKYMNLLTFSISPSRAGAVSVTDNTYGTTMGTLIVDGSNITKEYYSGTTIKINSESTDYNYLFDRVTSGSSYWTSLPVNSLSVNGNRVITVNYVEASHIIVSAISQSDAGTYKLTFGGSTIVSKGTAQYDYKTKKSSSGSKFTVTYTPATGYELTKITVDADNVTTDYTGRNEFSSYPSSSVFTVTGVLDALQTSSICIGDSTVTDIYLGDSAVAVYLGDTKIL